MASSKSSASVDVVAALFQAHKEQLGKEHAENRETLANILDEVRKTNGRVNDHEYRLRTIEQAARLISSAGERDWKRIGAGIGAVFFAIWGAVEVLKLCLDFLGKVGSTLVGK
jgi:hypothetical protein